MARTSRVELNRAAVGEVFAAMGYGLLALADAMLANTHPHDHEPFGQGLVRAGGTAVWVNGKKTGGKASKPRELRLQNPGAAAIVGYGFPGRFEELGTVDTPAHPFLTPGVMGLAPDAEVYISPAMRRRLAATTARRAGTP